jgi:hypothetical protein
LGLPGFEYAANRLKVTSRSVDVIRLRPGRSGRSGLVHRREEAVELYAAIDIHKQAFQAAVLDPESGEVAEDRFPADREALAV